MPLWKNTQHAFIAGQLDSNVMGRQDMDRYFKGATLLKNFLVKRQGCISKRRGTDLTADLDGLLGTTYDGTPITPGKMRLVPVTNGDDGRYVILSGGIGFVASRKGIMTADNRHVRKVHPYVALDEDGKASLVCGKDRRQSTETPVDLIHRVSAGNYVVTRHADTLDGSGNVTSSALQNAFNAAVDGDTVRLHSNIAIKSAVTVKRSNSWATDGGVAATVQYNDGTTGNTTKYKIVTGGQTYYSRETDYYGTRSTLTFNQRFVTATRNWSFSDGNAWSVAWSGNIWTFTRDDGGETVTATKNGRLDATTVTFTDGGETVTATCTWSFSGTDYDSSKTYTMTVENYYWRMKATDGSTTWSGLVYVPQYSATVDVVSTIGTVEEAAKTVTLDLYGYKITVLSSTGFKIPNASLTLAVDSSRTGGNIVLSSRGNVEIFSLISSVARVPSGSLHLIGDIAYDNLAGEANNWIVYGKDTSGVTVEAGSFTAYDMYSFLIHIDGGSLVINGGTFVNEVDGNKYVQLISLYHSSDVSKATSATINGGTFVNLSTYSGGSSQQYNSYVFCNYNGSLVINGGRFTFTSSARFCMYNASRGHLYWSSRFLRIVRGEFSQSAIKNGYDSNDYSLDMYTGDVGDTSSKTATEITFAMLGITATSGEWTLSDPGSLSFEWNTYNDKWHLTGTDSQGHSVSAWANGSPADTVVEFTTAGITATRSWTFSDGGNWPIGYAGNYWHITTSVLNAAQPNADGFYGVKVSGEGDYKWDGTSRSAAPYRFAIPYADDDLADLCIRQSGDTLFVAHRDYPPAKIYFDKHGNAYFEELTLDNTDYNPPVIESAEMVGQDPVETDWPTEFDSTLKTYAKSKGTVTNAGMNSNSSRGSDGSSQSATTWQATAESKDRASGKKTVTTVVKSSTSSVAMEVTRTYNNGLVTSETKTAVTTTGTAQNEASATSVIVTRTVKYVATYIKDGHESRPSAPVAVDYDMPWANNAVVNLVISKGANDEEPDYYNVYKDNGNGYGLIATTNVDAVAGGTFGSLNTYPLFTPDNTLDAATLVCMADLEEKKGWPVGDVMRKLVSTGRDSFTASPENDLCLISTAANSANGIQVDFGAAGARFNRIGVMLDGRIYDKERDASYVIVSTNRVTCTITYKKTDGTTATASKMMSVPLHYSWDGIAGGMVDGVYEDWMSLQRRAFTAPNGDTVYGWLYGKGDCSDDFNSHLRRLVFNLAEFTYSSGQDFSSIASVTAVKFTFSESVYTYWPTNQQGCIHAIHFYSGTSTASGGNVQDDYINPDMTVTPPDDTQDAHFSAADEYPGCVGIYEQRLVFASTRNSPSTIWMSRIADLYNFTVHDSIREDDALELTLAATEFPNINHLVTGRDLMLFGDGGEWLISPVTGNALTYKTASAKLQSMIGSDRALQPLQLADETLFAERGGTCLRTINYNYASDSYQSQDLSVIAQNLFRANPIVSMAYKQHPDSIVECVLADGRVATLVYMKEQEVAAWSIQELGGGWKAKEIVSPKCIVNGTTEMMLLVEKSGAFQLWKVRDDDDAMTDASQVVFDGMHIEASPAPTGTGEQGIALGDGTYAIGWPVESEFVSIRPEPEKGQTAQMEIKNATEAEIRVTDATTFKVKPYGVESGWREVTLPAVRSGANVTLSAKDCKRLMTGTNSRDGRLHLKHTEPWPLTILSISTTYQVEYENGTGEGGQ